MLNKFDEAIAALKDSSEYLNGIVEAEKRNEQTKKTEELIQDIEATRQEIALKITEVQEAKDQVRLIIRNWFFFNIKVSFFYSIVVFFLPVS